MSEIKVFAKDYPMAPIDKFIPYANNARTHSPEQINKLRSIYRGIGYGDPVEVDENFTILSGHGRVEAARAEGIYLYNDAIDFLSAYGHVSRQNRDFLQAVYSNAITDTINVICNSFLPPADKLREYRTIALHPLTQAAYRECTDESAAQSRKQLIQLALLEGIRLGTEDETDLCAVMQALLPRCGRALTRQNLPLLAQEETLLQLILEDDADQLLERLLTLIPENRYIKKYDLAGMVKALAADKPLLCQIEDAAFLREYASIYRMVWWGENLSALDQMTGLLLEEKKLYAPEQFLSLYLSIAALEGQAPAFVFGKLQLAKLYLRQDRREECRAAVEELAEMGLENEELFELRQALGGYL